jgi:hypothetical protein
MLRSLRRSYELTKDIAELDDTLSSQLSEAARLCTIETELHRVISLRYRLRLKFLKTPFVSNDTVIAMYAAGAVTHEEMVNIMRQNVGLTKLTESEIHGMFDEAMEITQLKASAATPLPPRVTTTETIDGVTSGGKAAAPPAASKPGGGAGGASASKPAGPAPPEKTSQTKTVVTEAESSARSRGEERENADTSAASDDKSEKNKSSAGDKRKSRK